MNMKYSRSAISRSQFLCGEASIRIEKERFSLLVKLKAVGPSGAVTVLIQIELVEKRNYFLCVCSCIVLDNGCAVCVCMGIGSGR